MAQGMVPTLSTLGTQVLADVVVHTHMLFEHILPGKGLPALLAGMAFHTCKQTATFQSCGGSQGEKLIALQLEAQ
jgi:hypothetical protein